jgi:hypothetical protein
MESTSSISHSNYKILHKTNQFTITNVFPLGPDPYNAHYESVNWAEVYRYYPPGNRYLNPFQRVFPPTDTRQLKVPTIPRKSATAVTTYSKYNRNPIINTYNMNFS